jgi:xylulokinase
VATKTGVALGLDLGTSGVRVVAVTPEGEVAAEASGHYPLHTPKPGWTEQDPADWVSATLGALEELAGRLQGHSVLALGLSGQMHGMVALGASSEVVRPAPLWNDQRTAEAVRDIEREVARKTLIAKTGNPAITGFQLPKVLWLRENEPENFARTEHVLLPKDYLGFVLTGSVATEPSDASGVGCLNLARKTWDEEILAALELSPALFPKVVASHEEVGGLRAAIAQTTGLPEGLPVIAGAGDNAAAATGLGLSSTRPHRGSVSLGTSGVLFVPLTEPTPDPQGRVHLFAHADGGYHLLGVTLAAAGSLQWYRSVFAPERDFDALMALAAESTPGANGVLFRPYLAGERTPHMNPELRGSWTGLSLATSQGDMVRSVLEGVAYSLRDALTVMTPLAEAKELLATGGGARSKFWLQIVADVLEKPILVPAHDRGAAYGAALLAWRNQGEEGAREVAVKGRLEPQPQKVYQEGFARYRAQQP